MSETENTASVAPGVLLGEARQAQNLGVADVARQLKLTVHQVEALEAGDYEKLPGPVFVRGFIRNYARLLKLDPEALVRAAVERLPHEEPRPAAPPSHDIPFPTVVPRRWPLYAVLVGVVVAALAAYEFYFSDSQPARAVVEPATGPAAEPVPQPVPQSVPVAPGAGAEGGPADPASSAPVPAAAPPAAPEGIPSTPAGPPDAGRSGMRAPEPGRSGMVARDAGRSGLGARDPVSVAGRSERQVRMVFKQESWVEIRDRNGKAIFSQLNRRGTEQRVNGEPPLRVVVGNSHGVLFTYDDQPVDLAQHTKIDVARFNLE